MDIRRHVPNKFYRKAAAHSIARNDQSDLFYGFENKLMKKKYIERLKLKMRAEKDPARVNGLVKQPSVVPRQGPPKAQQPKRRGEI